MGNAKDRGQGVEGDQEEANKEAEETHDVQRRTRIGRIDYPRRGCIAAGAIWPLSAFMRSDQGVSSFELSIYPSLSSQRD